MKPIALLLALFAPTLAAAADYPDLPDPVQVEAALEHNPLVFTARSGLKLEQANQKRWNSGPYEFNVRAGSAQRNVMNAGQRLKEWDVAVERPLRLPNKMLLDQDIGSAGVARAGFALGDARHEAARTLLRLWFAWQREQAAVAQWQQQAELLQRLSEMTAKRVQAGDAPQMELNQSQAAAAQAEVSRQQTQLRARLAANELARQFPGLPLPEALPATEPAAIEGDLAHWQEQVLQHNHELGMVQSERQFQELLAERSRADRLPDPTVGMRYSNEMGGNERITGVYVSVPLSFGQRWALAESAQQQAQIAIDRAEFVQQRLLGDVYAAHTQAVNSYATWQQATRAAEKVKQNAELVARAYSLGESSLADTLAARRLAQESALAERTARLDANEARYRLLLDAHQLWPLDADNDTHDHY